jgi:N-acetylglucosaminyldiphosphoundecaprenol N-acetyl-beta-D-mannosaminyltransferase
VQRVRTRFPGTVIVGTLAPPYVDTVDEDFARSTAEVIRTACADIVLVALGMPKQEIWMARVRSTDPARLLVGIGGTLELLAGIRWRVPEWVSLLGLEWLFRLVQEPTRLTHRYLVRDPRLFYWAVQARLSRGPA